MEMMNILLIIFLKLKFKNFIKKYKFNNFKEYEFENEKLKSHLEIYMITI